MRLFKRISTEFQNAAVMYMGQFIKAINIELGLFLNSLTPIFISQKCE